jgi:hypothetical protein
VQTNQLLQMNVLIKDPKKSLQKSLIALSIFILEIMLGWMRL